MLDELKKVPKQVYIIILIIVVIVVGQSIVESFSNPESKENMKKANEGSINLLQLYLLEMSLQDIVFWLGLISIIIVLIILIWNYFHPQYE